MLGSTFSASKNGYTYFFGGRSILAIFEGANQGDLIRPFFASWSNVLTFEMFLKITEVAQISGKYFQWEQLLIILAKNVLGYILGDFFRKLVWSPWYKLT
jgi:hypothetical protein